MIKIASRPESILEVDAFLEKIKEEYQVGEKQFNNMLISVNEAVTNSIRHGNQSDSSKQISIEFEKSSSGFLVIKVTDEGNGFNWKEADEAFAEAVQNNNPVEMNKEGGRGLFIMKNLADKRLFNKKGNSVALFFTT